MSMLPLDFTPVLAAFAKSEVPVTDMWGEYVDGVWVEDHIIEHRTITAIVLQIKPEELQFYSDGTASFGAISLLTNAELYYTDINAITQIHKQSYVETAGYRFRVVGTGFLENNTPHHQYIALRYYV